MRFEGKERRGKEKGCGSHQKKHYECRKDYVHDDVHIVATSGCRVYKYLLFIFVWKSIQFQVVGLRESLGTN
jgi:hypothetical protein